MQKKSMSDLRFEDFLLPGLPIERIRECYERGAGNEIASGKIYQPESSAALVANAFGFFLGRAWELPALPRTESSWWPAKCIDLEAIVRFPWSGGRHPCLDALIETGQALIGVESKRFEPFRSKSAAKLSDAYKRDVWGNRMRPYEQMRDALISGTITYRYLDAAQLVKHAFGLRTATHKDDDRNGKTPVLYYVFSEPASRPNGDTVSAEAHAQHRAELLHFSAAVAGAEVVFASCSYEELLKSWAESPNAAVVEHAARVGTRFGIK